MGFKLFSRIEFQGGDVAFLKFLCSCSDRRSLEPPRGCSVTAWAGICLRVAAHYHFYKRKYFIAWKCAPARGSQQAKKLRTKDAVHGIATKHANDRYSNSSASWSLMDGRIPSSALRDLLSLGSRLSRCWQHRGAPWEVGEWARSNCQ